MNLCSYTYSHCTRTICRPTSTQLHLLAYQCYERDREQAGLFHVVQCKGGSEIGL
jgi:hypothetical protein